MSELDIKKIRKDLGKTQKGFAEMLGVSERAVQSWESGKRKISKSTYMLIQNLIENKDQSNLNDALENDLNLDELALNVAKYENELMERPAFANVIEKRVLARILEMAKSGELKQLLTK